MKGMYFPSKNARLLNLLFVEFLDQLSQICMLLGKFSFNINGQVLKNIFAIWSHWIPLCYPGAPPTHELTPSHVTSIVFFSV